MSLISISIYLRVHLHLVAETGAQAPEPASPAGEVVFLEAFTRGSEARTQDFV